MHRGIALARGGDHFSGSVNLAAPLLPLGRRDQLIATEEVVNASRPRFRWQPLGEQTIRRVDRPFAVYLLDAENLHDDAAAEPREQE